MKIITKEDKIFNKRIYVSGCRGTEQKLQKLYLLTQEFFGADITSDVKIFILKDVKSVDNEFKRIYNLPSGYIAFYSRGENSIFFSVEDITKRVIVHEFSHFITYESIKQNYDITQNMHEIIAQGAERRLDGRI